MKTPSKVRRVDPFQLLDTEIGPYIIQSFVAKGATAAIYLGAHKKLQKVFALKIFPFSPFRSDFLYREAEILLSLNHPNIATAHEILQAKGWLCIAMEWISGGNLRKLLRKQKILSLEDWANIFLPILSALAYTHQNKILHLDLKPENILFTPTRQPKLVDFGTAALLMMFTGSRDYIVGTPEYLSPEQIRGEPISPRTDLYQIGILSWECLAGSPPFQGSVAEILAAHCYKTPSPVSLLPSVSALLLRLLQKNPEFRPFSAEEVIEEILEFGPSPLLSENSFLAPFIIRNKEKSRKRAIMQEWEKSWLTASGNYFQSNRFSLPFPAQIQISTVDLPKVYLHCPPLFFPRSRKIFFLSSAGSLIIYSIEDGQSKAIPLPYPPARGITLSSEGFCYVPTLGGGVFLISEEGETLQQILPGKWCAPSPLFWKNRLYIGCYDSNLYIFEPYLGQELGKIQTQGSIVNPPALTPLEQIVFGALDGIIYGILRNNEVSWRRKLDAPPIGSPVSSESGKCYVVTQMGTLYALDQATGEIEWYMERQVSSPPCLSHIGDPLICFRTGEIAYISSNAGIRWLFRPISLPALHPVSDVSGSFLIPLQNQWLLQGRFEEQTVNYIPLPFPLFALFPIGARELLGVSADGNWLKITESMMEEK